MKEETTNRKSSILMPVLIGSTIVAGIAVLLSPKKGKEITKDLKRFVTNTRDRIAEVIEGGREVVTEAVKAGKETYNEGTERLEKLMHKKERSLMAPVLASGIVGLGTALLMSPKAETKAGGDVKRIAVNARDKFVSAIDKGKAFHTEGRKAKPKAMEAGQKEYIRKNVKHRHAA